MKQTSLLLLPALLIATLAQGATTPDAALPAPTVADIPFTQVGGSNLLLDAYLPEGPGPFPACILVHGGGFRNGNKKSYIHPLFAPLRDAGFACFSVDYRLAPAHRWPTGIEDVEAAIRWLKAHAAEYRADPKRIALIGESAGGHYVSYIGVTAREPVQAVVPIYAPHDLEARVRQSQEIGASMAALLDLKEVNEDAFKKLRDASPIQHLRANLPPFLLLHGDKDTTVPLEQSTQFQARMLALGNPCDLAACRT
ncbi:MAG: alpha/beta hydrolase [Verrucomicrobiota bacterium]